MNKEFKKAICNSIQANKDKIEKLNKQNVRLKKQNKQLKERIDKAIAYNKQIIKDIKDFYRPTADIIYSGDSLIDNAEMNLQILGDKE